ncbi:MAG: isocitrate lyase/PEP mutase family protein [Gammaproteobacteria bacterium]|nr:isocitrate lyase/PEP mutase family protein [Gammaproteobacteria bacterium]
MRPSSRLKAMIADGKTHIAPGAYDGLSARIIQNAGAELLYATGGGIARSTGVPDMGLISVKEVTDRLQQMVDAVDIPVIADMDTGYGNALNARRAVRAFERAGVAGFHIEDQVFPKRCGHLEGKAVVGEAEFCAKLRAVRDSLDDDDTVVIARTDAIAVEGLDAALDRMHRYIEAGADVAFVEAPRDESQIERIARELPCPKLLNMFWGGKTPILARDRLEALGFNLVIVPGDLQRGAIRVMQELAAIILRDGHTESAKHLMASFEDREAAVDTAHYMELDGRYGH